MQSDIVRTDALKNLTSAIEHTLLKPEARRADIEKLCHEARRYQFFGVCINSSYIEYAKKVLAGSSVKLVSVIGFPLGTMETTVKAFETEMAIAQGADEIDMVIHVGALKDRQID